MDTLTIDEASNPDLRVLAAGPYVITQNDGRAAGTIVVSRNRERLSALRDADGALVRTDYTASQLVSLAEWLENRNNWRADQQ